MADLVVIVPSRGRPRAAKDLDEAFEATCTADTKLVFAVDGDDPTRDEYVAAAVRITTKPTGTNMVDALNFAADLHAPLAFAIGFMGDDHRPRTQGWDQAYLAALREMGTGIVYGNDLLQGEALPTQVAMTADIIRELGWMAPPALVHMYVDNWWRDLGRTAGCLRYLPDVVVEHMHPVAGKAEWDEGHRRVNAQEMYARDEATYVGLRTRVLPGAAVRIRALRRLVLALRAAS